MMDDSSMQGLNKSEPHLTDQSRIQDSSYGVANQDQMERRNLFNNKGGQLINIEDQLKRRSEDQAVNILNIRNINSEQKVRQANPKNVYVPDKANKTTMNKWYNVIDDAAAAKSPSKFKRAGMKVVRKIKDPEHFADEFGDDKIDKNSRYSKSKTHRTKSENTRRQKSMDYYFNQSNA